MRRLILITSIFLGAIIASFGCGGTSATPTSEGTAPISIETLDEGETYAIDSTFETTFGGKVVDTDTTTTSSIFMVQEAACSEATCDPNSVNLVTTTLDCSKSTDTSSKCTLTPVDDLDCGTHYCICMTSDIKEPPPDGAVIFENGFQAGFTTVDCEEDEATAPTIPTIFSVKDVNGEDLSTTTTGIVPTSFDIEFSDAMEDESVTTDGNITLTCGDLTPTISVAASESADNTYTVTVTDAWRYALMECTLTITTGVTSLDGGALAESEPYTFANTCAVSDDFNAQSISDEETSCWDILFGGSWADMSGVMDLDTANSVLSADFSSTEGITNPTFVKTVSVESDFVLEIYFKSISGFVNPAGGGAEMPSMALFTISSHSSNLFWDSYWVGIYAAGGTQTCIIAAWDKLEGGGQTVSVYTATCDQQNTGYYIRLEKPGDTFTRQYKEEGGEYADLELHPLSSPWPSVVDLDLSGENRRLGLAFYSPSANGGELAEVESVYVDGVSMEGQY